MVFDVHLLSFGRLDLSIQLRIVALWIRKGPEIYLQAGGARLWLVKAPSSVTELTSRFMTIIIATNSVTKAFWQIW